MPSASSPSAREQVKFPSPMTVYKNNSNIQFVRGVVTGLGALAVGILGYTGSAGLYAYGFLHVLTSLLLLTWMRWQPATFVPQSSVPSFFASGIVENALLFVFLWTLAYALVHIY